MTTFHAVSMLSHSYKKDNSLSLLGFSHVCQTCILQCIFFRGFVSISTNIWSYTAELANTRAIHFPLLLPLTLTLTLTSDSPAGVHLIRTAYEREGHCGGNHIKSLIRGLNLYLEHSDWSEVRAKGQNYKPSLAGARGTSQWSWSGLNCGNQGESNWTADLWSDRNHSLQRWPITDDN